MRFDAHPLDPSQKILRDSKGMSVRGLAWLDTGGERPLTLMMICIAPHTTESVLGCLTWH
jgi:hypothetical protein